MRFFNNEIFFYNGLYFIHSQGFCKTCYFKGNGTCNLPRNEYSNNITIDNKLNKILFII